MTSGLPFSAEIRDLLVDTARRMKRQKLNRQRFKPDTYGGEIRTQFTPYFVSSFLHGIMFTAELECEEGATTALYLVTPQELKEQSDPKWSPWYKLTAMHPRENAANN